MLAWWAAPARWPCCLRAGRWSLWQGVRGPPKKVPRAAPSSPSPALAPGTSLPVRRGGMHGGGVAAVCAPGCSRGLAWLPSLPPANVASTQEQGQRPPATRATGFYNPFQKKETLESLHKTVALVAGPGLPALSAPVQAAAAAVAGPGLGRFSCVGAAAVAGPRRTWPLPVRWRCGGAGAAAVRCPWQPWRRVLVPVPGTGSPAFAGCLGGGGGVSCF